jgi:hypothetical protein
MIRLTGRDIDHSILIVGGGFVLIAAFILPHLPFALPDLCWIHRLTGLPCAGCGLTRSMTSIASGNFSLAWTYHPFGYYFFFLAIMVVVTSALLFFNPKVITPHLPDIKRIVIISLYAVIAGMLIRWIILLIGIL